MIVQVTRTIMLNLLTKYLLTFVVYCISTKLHEHHEVEVISIQGRGGLISQGEGEGEGLIIG